MGHQAHMLMCPPEHYGIEYEINPWMSRGRNAEREIARQQWAALRELIEGLGARVSLLEAVAGLPDLVFTANAGVVWRDLFVSSRFRYGVRAGESPIFERWFAAQGFRVEQLPEGMYFEGAGDALFCGETLLAGYRFRSDVRAHQYVAGLLGCEVLPMELVSPYYYHLDTCFCPLSAGESVYFPGAFDDYGRAVIRAHVARLIEVRAEEAERFAANAVVIGRSVIVNAGCPHLEEELKHAGYRAIATPLDEFLKAGGSAKCLTLRVDGEEAAAWARHDTAAGSVAAAATHSRVDTSS